MLWLPNKLPINVLHVLYRALHAGSETTEQLQLLCGKKNVFSGTNVVAILTL